jgi:thiol-disulfide isomerase/thioredoxin
MSRSICVAAALLIASAVGCQQTTTPTLPSTKASAPAAGSPALSPAEIKLVQGDEKKLGEMLAAHKGKVVFVDYWATWCHPCVEAFPHTVEMHQKYKDQGLATIAVTFDEPSEEPKAREFLAKQHADFENLLSTYGQGSAAFEGFGIDLVPHFRLYDRQGKLRHKWDAAPKDAEQKIEELLAEK